MDVFISPHNDDEALFGAYVCIPHKPRVIVVLRSYVEASWSPPVSFETREAESAASCAVLGCEYEQWEHPDNAIDWAAVHRDISALEPERIWAPLPEPGGHHHHNRIGTMVADLFPQTVWYATYTHAGGKTTTGLLAEPEEGWEKVKREAMACYVSQATHPQCAVAFSEWAIDEFYTESALVTA